MTVFTNFLQSALTHRDLSKDDLIASEMIEKLINKVDINEIGNNGLTPLNTAIDNGRIEALKKMFSKPGLKIDNFFNKTPTLCYAIKTKGSDILGYLLISRRFDIHVRTIDNRLLIDYATSMGNLEACKLIMNFDNTAINIQNKYGWTPLHYAANSNSIEILSFFMDIGGNPFIKTNGNNTCLDIAKQNRYHFKQIIEYLQKFKKIINVKCYLFKFLILPLIISVFIFKKHMSAPQTPEQNPSTPSRGATPANACTTCTSKSWFAGQLEKYPKKYLYLVLACAFIGIFGGIIICNKKGFKCTLIVEFILLIGLTCFIVLDRKRAKVEKIE